MCHVFVGADPGLWENQTRSIRMGGVVTSVRLERMFWTVLDEIAVGGDLTVPQLLHQLYDESVAAGHDAVNFTSFLRVCCLRFSDLRAGERRSKALARETAGDEIPRLTPASTGRPSRATMETRRTSPVPQNDVPGSGSGLTMSDAMP